MSNSRMLLGLASQSYYSSVFSILNMWKVGNDVYVNLSDSTHVSGQAAIDAGYLDLDGELVNPVPANVVSISRVFFTQGGPGQVQYDTGQRFDHEPFVMTWTGAGAGQIDFLTSGNTVDTSVANKISFTLGDTPNNTQAQIVITDRNNPPKNIKIYPLRHQAAFLAGSDWNPVWMNEVSQFGCLRFMDLMGTNGSRVVNYSDFATEPYFSWTNVDNGKQGLPISVIIKLVIASGVKRCWVNIPHLATEACVTSMATALRDGLAGHDVIVHYEFSNELWNFQFAQCQYAIQQAATMFPSDGEGFYRWSGRQASIAMNAIRNVYNDPTRWRGVMASFTEGPTVTLRMIDGFNLWKSQTSSTLNITDLFQELAITGYFNEVQISSPISNITKGNPAVVTSNGHNKTPGQRIKLFIRGGMTQLNDTYATVGPTTTNTFELVGVNTSSYTTWADDNNFFVPALLWEVMDESATRHTSDPTNYPTKYTYFNQQMAQAAITGTSTSGVTVYAGQLPHLEAQWAAHMAIVQPLGMDVVQYEGGLHMLGDIYLAGYSGTPQFNEYLFNYGHSAEVAVVYKTIAQAFYKMGGKRPAKFVEAGSSSQYGTWGGFQFLPTVGNSETTDTTNPVWQAVKSFNSGVFPETYTIRTGSPP
ncbi:MAG: hypothetical protein JWN75_1186 [Candidatus Saccharibacteria bacterium]|nr:hypothetical protein [Candidatus Saccharibacteria bacterium]